MFERQIIRDIFVGLFFKDTATTEIYTRSLVGSVSVYKRQVIGVTSKIPDNQLPEIAFAGKSNVGKSSLINALMNRKSLARTSAQPGKTPTINFYNINDELYFVELPGYVYAKVSQQEKDT